MRRSPGVILDESSHAPPQERIREALRLHLESYRREAKIIGVIEQMARYDKHVNAVRRGAPATLLRNRWPSRSATFSSTDWPIPTSIRRVASAALGAMVTRFAEMWLVQGAVSSSFDKAVDQLARLFVNALGLSEDRRRRAVAGRPGPADARRSASARQGRLRTCAPSWWVHRAASAAASPTGLADRGSHVAVLARRYDRLSEAAKEAGPNALAIACDVTDEASCPAPSTRQRGARWDRRARLHRRRRHARASGRPGRATWRQTLDTNVVGAALVTAAAVPHLTASQGVAAYLSSVSASMTPPWPGLGAYIVSKAALDKLVEAWQVEHPAVGFTRVIVGDCAGGEGTRPPSSPTPGTPTHGGVLPHLARSRLPERSLLDVEALVHVVESCCAAGPRPASRRSRSRPRPPAP